MRVFVTGATGALGRHLVPGLVAAGHEVTAATRAPGKVAQWLPYLAQVAGAKPPRRVPAWLGRLLAGEFVVAQMTSARGSSNQKARKQLGWEPRYPSWREGFRAWARG
jgi:nucleoside-diphosphate-sugar epimerase